MATPTYLTAAQAADKLHVSPWRITEACRSKQIKAAKPGKTWLITPEDLDAYVERYSNTEDAA